MPELTGITVSQLNLIIAEAIRKDPRIRSITVQGEISGFRNHLASGHWYFVLKDEESAVNCVMFRQNTFHAAIRPKDGESVLASGYVDVYPKNGTYQLYVTGLRKAGTGDMFERFEALKRKLYNEGLFDPRRKKPLPILPRKVAVVTSSSGAALQDIYNVSAMRSPFVPIVLIPVTVQGENAAKEIAQGIRKAWKKTDADVIIVARGGGSAEDLWCFNDETIARTIADSPIPVVSGIGHEIDNTICDLAADVRASTPSNAAEIVFPDKKELQGRIQAMRLMISRAAHERIRSAQDTVRDAYRHLETLSPQKRVAKLEMQSQLVRARMIHAIRTMTDEKTSALREMNTLLDHTIRMRMEKSGMALTRLKERLEALNPFGVLNRGYTLVYDQTGTLMKRKTQAIEQERLRIRFSDGEIEVDYHG